MARIKTLPAAIKTRIEEIPELRRSVVIFKMATVEADFKARMEKVRGKACIIRVTGGRNEASGKKSAFACTVTVSLFMVPTLADKQPKDCEALMSEIEAKLHGWWPESVAHNTAVYLKSETITFPDSNTYDIAVLSLKTPPTPLI
jgi:hypothetical protein